MYFVLLNERFLQFSSALQLSKGSHTHSLITLFVVVQVLSRVCLCAPPGL